MCGRMYFFFFIVTFSLIASVETESPELFVRRGLLSASTVFLGRFWSAFLGGGTYPGKNITNTETLSFELFCNAVSRNSTAASSGSDAVSASTTASASVTTSHNPSHAKIISSLPESGRTEIGPNTSGSHEINGT